MSAPSKYSVRFILLVFLAFLTGLPAAAQRYTITDLGPINPRALNSWGQIVGDYNGHAVLWTKFRGLEDLRTLLGGTFSTAAAINDLGVVTGTSDGAGTVVYPNSPELNVQCDSLTQPFVWTPGRGMRGLGTIAPLKFLFMGQECNIGFFATGNNLSGQVVGYSGSFASFQWPFQWTGANGMTVLTGGNVPATSANAVSNTGQVVGEVNLGGPYGHAMAWKDGAMTDLGTLVEGPDWPFFFSSSYAKGVNDLGQIVGWSVPAVDSQLFHAVLWSPSGAIQDLGTLRNDTSSMALKINLFGQVIGTSGNTVTFNFDKGLTTAGVCCNLFVWSERSGMRDLNKLIGAKSGWTLTSVADINVWGQIVGQGIKRGQPHGFLLTPRILFQF